MKNWQYYTLLGTMWLLLAQGANSQVMFIISAAWAFLLLGAGLLCAFVKV